MYSRRERKEDLRSCTPTTYRNHLPMSLHSLANTVETRIKEPTFLGDSLLKDLIAFTIHILGMGKCEYSRNPHRRTYVFGRQPVKGSYLLPLQSIFRDWGSVSLIKTCLNCIFITVALSPIIYSAFKDILSKL